METDPWAAVRALEGDSGLFSLMDGSPGPETLRDCKEMMKTATCHALNKDADSVATFSYGPETGDAQFRNQLARFLSLQYGDVVNSDQVMVTSGAMSALHTVATLLLSPSCPVFMEDPTFFGAIHMLEQDLRMQIIPVPCDNDGMDTDALDRLLTTHRPTLDTTQRKPFWAMVYTVPVFSNPSGLSYSPSRCRRLVELARKHDVLVIAEDVYNLLHFGESHPPKRLLTYDDPSDPNYKGHVLSSGTFSKILSPGLRLGWVEGPDRILTLLRESTLLWVGGSPNHYTSIVVAAALELGLQSAHLHTARHIYKKRMDTVCRVLSQHKPEGTSFTRPQGGVFLWITFPEGSDTVKMMQWMAQHHRIAVMPGVCTSAGGQYRNCIRVSISFYQEEMLEKLMTTVCTAAKEFLTLSAGC